MCIGAQNEAPTARAAMGAGSESALEPQSGQHTTVI